MVIGNISRREDAIDAFNLPYVCLIPNASRPAPQARSRLTS